MATYINTMSLNKRRGGSTPCFNKGGRGDSVPFAILGYHAYQRTVPAWHPRMGNGGTVCPGVYS